MDHIRKNWKIAQKNWYAKAEKYSATMASVCPKKTVKVKKVETFQNLRQNIRILLNITEIFWLYFEIVFMERSLETSKGSRSQKTK